MWRRLVRLACALLLFSACAPSQSSAATTPLPRPTLDQLTRQPVLRGTVVSHPPFDSLLASVQPDPSSNYGVVVEDLASGDRLAVNHDRVFASASVYKLPLAWQVIAEADQGHFSLDDSLDILDADAVEPEPEGGLAPGDPATIREALERMVSVSSNASAHALLRTIGRAEFNSAMDKLGLHDTRVPETVDVNNQGPGAVTTADDVALLLRMIARRQTLSVAAETILLNILAQAQYPDPLRETMPDDVVVLDKTGNLADASNVGGLLVTPRGSVLLVVLDEGVDPAEARSVIAQFAAGAYSAYLQ
jgi:beta-lactamase class A